ncbi:hypothetical protein F443_03742 [Phytophthora nicotianae P1569]|uniref:RxLR effector protein n=1 Tax=Phytophthora nicotianae P1569 TaxID=1317065 RepID=V9FP89_PHYNI|nr:hypothetical protein F443_03742 [Phytophthora nicotianae P1569]
MVKLTVPIAVAMAAASVLVQASSHPGSPLSPHSQFQRDGRSASNNLDLGSQDSDADLSPPHDFSRDFEFPPGSNSGDKLHGGHHHHHPPPDAGSVDQHSDGKGPDNKHPRDHGHRHHGMPPHGSDSGSWRDGSGGQFPPRPNVGEDFTPGDPGRQLRANKPSENSSNSGSARVPRDSSWHGSGSFDVHIPRPPNAGEKPLVSNGERGSKPPKNDGSPGGNPPPLQPDSSAESN